MCLRTHTCKRLTLPLLVLLIFFFISAAVGLQGHFLYCFHATSFCGCIFFLFVFVVVLHLCSGLVPALWYYRQVRMAPFWVLVITLWWTKKQTRKNTFVCFSDIDTCLPVPTWVHSFWCSFLWLAEITLAVLMSHTYSSAEEDWGHVYTEQDQRVLL